MSVKRKWHFAIAWKNLKEPIHVITEYKSGVKHSLLITGICPGKKTTAWCCIMVIFFQYLKCELGFEGGFMWVQQS